MINERGKRGGTGSGAAPFYAPPLRRKTSAEIISEARAALLGDVSASGSTSGLNTLKALPTRRPYTPRETQRLLFADNASKRRYRPPSAFSLKYVPPSEGDGMMTLNSDVQGGRLASLDDATFQGLLLTEQDTQKGRKQAPSQSKMRSMKSVEELPTLLKARLPNLNCNSKVLTKRRTTAASEKNNSGDAAPKNPFENIISITQPLVKTSGTSTITTSVEEPTTLANKRRNYVMTKSRSQDSVEYGRNTRAADTVTASPSRRAGKGKKCNDMGIAVKKLEVHVPRGDLNYPNETDTIALYYEIIETADMFSKKTTTQNRSLALLNTMEAYLKQSAASTLRSANGTASQQQHQTNSMEQLPGVVSTSYTGLAARTRAAVLRSLLSHCDSDDDAVILNIAKLLLMMRVTGNNLSVAFKLMFKVAKNDSNDHLFKSSDILEYAVEGAGRACPVREGECCVYADGALRFLALDPELRTRAANVGALQLAALHLKLINTSKAESPRSISEQTSHALYQLTGALRNFASGPELAEQFISTGLMAVLCDTLKFFITDLDVVTNVVRTFSVLSSRECCCTWAGNSVECSKILQRTLSAVASRAPLAVRLTYTLGNMAAVSSRAREHIYSEPGSIDCILTILESYLSLCHIGDRTNRKKADDDVESYFIGSDLAGSSGSNEDVLIKTLRVLANLCLDEDAGRGLVENHSNRLIRALTACCSEDIQTNEEYVEELISAALATLNNLTYYYETNGKGESNVFDRNMNNLMEVCRASLIVGGVRALQSIRALGNLTKNKKACQLLTSPSALKELEPFLTHDEGWMRSGAAGVMVNVCAASAGDSSELAACVGQALCSVAVLRDVNAACLLSRALWNALAAGGFMTPSLTKKVTASLKTLLDDDSYLSPCELTPNDINQRTFEGTSSSSEEKRVRWQSDTDYITNRVEDVDDSGLEDLDYGCDDGVCFCGGECKACVNVADWEEFMNVALPLLESLKPLKHDASVGTES